MANIALDLSTIIDRLSATSRRPRYAMMVLNLLSEAADPRGHAGPFVTRNGETLPIRLWLGETLARMSARHARRSAMRARVIDAHQRGETGLDADLPAEPSLTGDEDEIERAVQERARISGGTNVSRAVTDLVRCGLVRRQYQGQWTGHHNKGGQRHAVYIVEADTMAALRRGSMLL